MTSCIQQILPETLWIDGRLFQEPGIYPNFVAVFQGSLVSLFTLLSSIGKMEGPCHGTNSPGNLLQSQRSTFIPGSGD